MATIGGKAQLLKNFDNTVIFIFMKLRQLSNNNNKATVDQAILT